MNNLFVFFSIVAILYSVSVIIKNLSYAKYEIKEKENKTGGIAVIVFTIFSIVFYNIILYMQQ